MIHDRKGVAVAALVLVAGCGSGQEAPPNVSAQAQAESAQPGHEGRGGHHGRHMPPPAAFEACKDKAIGTACTVTFHEHEISGKCESPPPGAAQTTPACRPEGGPRHRAHHGAPPEIVFAACDAKAAGDACTVTFERGTVEGSCMAPRHDADAGAERLLCAPAHRQGREPGTGAGGGK